VVGPAEDAAVVVSIKGLHPELNDKALQGDVLANDVDHGDAGHGAATAVVEASKTVKEAREYHQEWDENLLKTWQN
jgi:hypothetical protein